MRGVETALITPPMRTWAERSIGRIGRRLGPAALPANGRRRRRVLVVHLDGVPRQVLAEAIDTERMPFLSHLVRTGAYHFDRAFWGSPASTPAFQAGVLYGIRHPNLPAYHWYDRGLGREIRMNAPRDAADVEARVVPMARPSLLEGGGTTYLSLFQGGAANELAMTSVARLRRMLPSLLSELHGLRTVKRQPVRAYLRALLGETVGAGREVVAWSRRIHDSRHEVQYLLNRIVIMTLAWGLSQNRALIDMVRGVPAVYLVFGNYDEVAHRRGPFSPQAAAELYRVDRALEELYAIAHLVEQPYEVVLVTDHGHVDSAPFEQRTGQKVEAYLLHGPKVPLAPDLERGLLDGRRPLDGEDPREDPREDPVVIEAGNFAHVYLSRGTRPLEARELLAHHREVLARAAVSPEIGIVALRRGEGAVALVGGGVYGPDELDRAPLSPEFSRVAVADLLRELRFMPTAGDLILYGQATHPGGTVGFAWEFGSHGGLTRTETDSVVLWPSEAGLDLGALGHSTQLYERLSEVYRQ